jgi:hypothetical protein
VKGLRLFGMVEGMKYPKTDETAAAKLVFTREAKLTKGYLEITETVRIEPPAPLTGKRWIFTPPAR